MFIDGVELEVNAVPMQRLLFNASVGYLDFRMKDLGAEAFQPASVAPTLTTQPPYVPSLKLSAGLQYTIQAGAAGAFIPRLDWNYQSQVFNDPTNAPIARQGGYGLVNARITFIPQDSKWQMALEAKNLLQKVYYVNMSDFLPSYGTLDAQPGPPRMILGTIRRTF